MSREEYAKARKAGEKAVRRALSEHRSPSLPVLDELLKDRKTAGEVPVGTLEIPLAMVSGTLTAGRQNAFACNFMPVMEEDSEFAGKWSRLYDSQIEEGIREPIIAYEYMKQFYVREGNKRVSVLKYLDVPSIEAQVTRVLPVRTQDRDVQVYYEFLEFYKAAPFYDITFSKPGSYRRFASLLGRTLSEPWPADLINTVRGAYFRFSTVFAEKGGSRLQITCGDAFLIYLLIYQFDSLLDSRRENIAKRLNRIWDELLVEENNEDAIALREVPEESRESSFLAGLLNRPPLFTEKKPLQAAFLYQGAVADSGWASDHDVGRIYLENSLEGIVRTFAYEKIDTDEACAGALEDAVKRGADVVFTTSPALMSATLRAAIRWPAVRFFNCSVYVPHSAVHTYYAREYEAKFLMGALAAVYAADHRIGYLAEDPSYGTIASINAFAIGAGMIDPEAEIYLSWSGTRSGSWKQELEQQNLSVYCGADLSFAGWDQPEYGLCRRLDGGRSVSLASPVRNWGRFYERIVRQILHNSMDSPRKGQAVNDWWGMSAGVIDVNLSGQVSYYSRKMIDLFRQGLKAGTLDPFEGELRSQEGIVQAAGSPRLAGERIITMDWLNDNVNGAIPEFKDLNDESRKSVEVSGVRRGDL